MTTSTLSSSTTQQLTQRIQSIDLLRGVVMVIMALDHVRDYFHADAFLFNPLDLSQTSPTIFATRWVTHFCAPVFVFLAGTSAFLVGSRKGKVELSAFLLKRGLWLIFLEFTVVNFAWFFNIQFPLLAFTVIWALGLGMVLLSFAVRLPFNAVFVLGLALVFGHNLLDGVHVEGNSPLAILWTVLHEFNGHPVGPFFLFVGYPILPWAGVMFLGYCFGRLYTSDVDALVRRKTLMQLGLGSLLLFVIVRAINIYGDPVPWSGQPSLLYTILSFINITKYPPSMLYIVVLLGPAFLFLAFTENLKGKWIDRLNALGRVPMFYYIIHLYWIHILAVFAALATGFSFSDMVFNTWITDSPNLKGYGFSLLVVYAVWAFVVLSLWPLCIWYDRYKTNNRQYWWLSYL